MGGSSWRSRTDTPPNKGAKYPPEVLTPAEVAAIIGQCSHVRALKGRPNGPSPVDRARPGSKHHLITRGAEHPADGVH